MIHDAAAEGFQREAGTYQSARPSYRPEVAARCAELASGGLIVELGAGTGIFTRQLLQHDVQLVAVEPVEAMRSTLIAASPDVDVEPGTAESIPLSSGAARMVVASQSFHWFDHGPALDEIARVLEPGGFLITVWNVRDESVPWVAAYTGVMDRHAGDTPRYRTMEWRRAIEADPRFAATEELAFTNPSPTDADGVVARGLSTSFIAALDAESQERVAADLRAIVAPLGERFDYPYVSELQAWSRNADHDDSLLPIAEDEPDG